MELAFRIPMDTTETVIYSTPEEIGNFSLDENGDIVFANDQLKYLAIPPNDTTCSFNLNDGFERAIRKTYQPDKKLDNFLKWINRNYTTQQISLDYQFVCYKGALQRILNLPYFKRKEDFVICASKHRGVIYLWEYYDPVKEQEKADNITERQRRMYSWGHKFEQYLTSSTINGKPDTRKAVNENEEFRIVVKAKLDAHSILMTAEVDCVDPNKKDSTSMDRYVELKTFGSAYNYKYIIWWSQSFLAGIERIVCGEHNEDGIVLSIKELKTSELLHLAPNFWNSQVCLNHCNKFLTFVQKTTVKDDPKIVIKFSYDRQKDHITAEELPRNSTFCFLPDWY